MLKPKSMPNKFISADEAEVYDFLKQFPNLFVSVMEISKKVGNRKRYHEDRTWARPILRRMELDGLVEVNDVGEYRLKASELESPDFLQALARPAGVDLGDTTIIRIDDVQRV